MFLLFRLSYTYLMWKRLGGEPLYNAEVAISMILILSGSFPRYTQWEWYLNLQKENWFFGITHLYYPRSPMFVSLDKSFNVGDISRTSWESSGGTLPSMIHRGGPSPSFLVRAFKPFRPWPRIESITLIIAPHDLHVISVEIEIVVRDWWGLIINCHWCVVATSSDKCSRHAQASRSLINGMRVYEQLDGHSGKPKRVRKTKGYFLLFSRSLLFFKRGNSEKLLSSHFPFLFTISSSFFKLSILLFPSNFSSLTQVCSGILSLFL